jgi:hypothetical protein
LYGTLVGAIIDGVDGNTVAHGVRASTSILIGVRVRRLGGSANGIVSTGNDTIVGCTVTENAGGTSFVTAQDTIPFIGNNSDTGDSHLSRLIHRLTTPLSDFFEWNDETRLTGATDPALDTSVDGGRVYWPAGNTDAIGMAGIPLPVGFDGTQDVIVRLKVSSGTTNATNFTVHTFWDGGTVISDGVTGATASATPHIVVATISAGDIPDGATYLALLVQPAAHAIDDFTLYEVRAEVAQKVIQGIPS